MTSMRAVRFHEYGSPDVLQVDQVPVPVPADGEVLVRVHAAGLGGGELAIRAGRMQRSRRASVRSSRVARPPWAPA